MIEKHIVSFSGGKDSTAMLLMMIKNGMQIDDIIFCDTGMEFPFMYDHIEKVEKYIGRKITVLKANKTFEYYLLEAKKTRGKYIDTIGYGFPRLIKNRWCTSKLKTDVIKKYIKENYTGCKIVEYIGIAYDETKRIKDKKYPLIDWKITERKALEYCYSNGFDWGGLYNIFNRVSCWCCPMQSLGELKKLKDNFPELYSKIIEWEKQTYNNFRQDYSMQQLEIKFAIEDDAIKNNINPRGKIVRNQIKEAIREQEMFGAVHR